MRVRSRSKKTADRPGGDPPPTRSSGIDFDDDRVALAAARADGRAAQATSAPAQLVDERPEDPRARRADRVAEGHRPAIDVDLAFLETEHAHRVERDRGKRLVDLPQVDVIDAQAGLLERLLGRVRRGPS